MSLPPSLDATSEVQRWTRRGREQLMAGLIRAAHDCVERALAAGPPDGELHLLEGLVLERLRRPSEAARAYRMALESGVLGAQVWARLGSVLSEIGRDPEAVQALHRALEDDPNDPMVWNDLGNAELALGRLDAADRAYQRALAEQAENVFAHCGRAHVARIRGAHAEAAQHARRASTLDPEDGKARVLYAWMASAAGREREARGMLEALGRTSLEPADRWIAAQVLESSGAPHTAREHLAAIVDSRPLSGADHCARACAVGRLLGPAAGVAACEEGLALLPRDLELQATRVLLLNDAGRTTEAVQLASALGRERPTHPDLIESILQTLIDVFLIEEARAFLRAIFAHEQRIDARLRARLCADYPIASAGEDTSALG